MIDTRLGLHVATGSRNGYAITAPKARGVVVFDGGGAMDEVHTDTFRVYRPDGIYAWPPGSEPGESDIMPGFDQLTIDQMDEQAAYWWPIIRARVQFIESAHGRIDAVKCTNEVGGNDQAQIQKLVAYERALMNLARLDGYRLVVANCATNSPHWDTGIWQSVVAPFVVEAWAGGHVYGRHAYADNVGGVDRLIVNGQPAGDSSGRPFREIDYFLQTFGHCGPIVLGEVGFVTFPGVPHFMQEIAAYDAYLQQYPQIGFGAIFTYGKWGTANIEAASQPLGDYMTANPFTKWEPGVDTPPDPPPADCCDELRARLDALEARVTALENAGTKPPPDPDPDPPPIPDPVSTDGVDISRYQQGINWTVFKQGLGFIFIKVGSGELPTDPMFTDHWQKAAGVLRGAYWYQYPDSVMPAAQQAAEFWARLPKDCELPPMLDVEQVGLTRAMVQAFVDAFTAVSGGMMLGIYTSASKWSQLTGNLPLPNSPLWVANWTTAPRPLIPPTWSTWVFWQYTSDGSRPGYKGRLDLDRFNGTAAQLGQFARSWPRAGWTPGTPPTDPPPPTGQTVDLRPYIEPTGDVGQFTVLAHLGGAWTQDQQLQRRADGAITLIKGNDYERWRIAANGDMLRYEDTSMSADAAYTQNGARWLPGVVTVGATYTNSPRITVKRKADCALLSDQVTTDYLTVAKLHTAWTSPANPALVFANVLEIHWRKSASGPIQERYFLAPRLAYVAWGRDAVEAAVSELPQGRPSLPWQSWGCG